MSRSDHSKATGRSERLFNDLPLHLYSRYVDSRDFLSRPRRPNSTDAGVFSSTSLPRVTSASAYYPSSAPTSPVPPYTRSSGWQVPTTTYTPGRPLSTGATLSLPSRDQSKSPIYSPASASPYSTRSPSPSLQQQESRIPARPASPYYATSIYDRSPVPPPPPARLSSYQVTIPPPPPRPMSPPPPPPRLYSFVPLHSSSRSPTIKTVSERLLDLERECEETASSIAHLPDSHEISSEGNMLANDLDRSVSRSESFIKEVEEKLLGLGHKVELPSYSPSSSSRGKNVIDSDEKKGDKYLTQSSHVTGSHETLEKTPTSTSPEKEYVGWRQRMGSVYEVEIKDEKQLLDEIGRRKKRSISENVKNTTNDEIDLTSVLANADSVEVRRRRESNKPRETKEPSEQQHHDARDVSSCFQVTSAYEERKKEQKAKASPSQAWNVKDYLPQILGGLLILWIIISLLMSGKKVERKTKIEKTLPTVKVTPSPVKIQPTTSVRSEKAQSVKTTTKMKQEKVATVASTTTTATTKKPEKAKKDKAKETSSTTIAPSVSVKQDVSEKIAEVKEQSIPITSKANSTKEETVKTKKKKKESTLAPNKEAEERERSPVNATMLLPDDKRLEKAAKVVKKAIKECKGKFEMSSDKIQKIIEKTVNATIDSNKKEKNETVQIDSKKKKKAERPTASVNQTNIRVNEVTEAPKTKKIKVNKSASKVTKEEEKTTSPVKSQKKEKITKSANVTVEVNQDASAKSNITSSRTNKSVKSKQESVTGETKKPVKVEAINVSTSKMKQSDKNVTGKNEPVKKEKKKVTSNGPTETSVNVTANSNATLSASQGNKKAKGNR